MGHKTRPNSMLTQKWFRKATHKKHFLSAKSCNPQWSYNSYKDILPNNKATMFIKVEAIEGRKTGNKLISRDFNITTQCKKDHSDKHE